MAATLAQTVCVFLITITVALQVGRGTEVGSSDRSGAPAFHAVAAPTDGASQADETVDQSAAEFEPSDEPVQRRFLRVTAYCDRGLTAAGVQSGEGQCAAPADIPLGSKVYIPELDRTLIVTDRTHKRFRHNTIDIFMPSRDACLQFGRKYLTCEITLPAEAHRYGSTKIVATIAAVTD